MSALSVTCAVFALSGFAQPGTPSSNQGEVIRATGIGRPPADKSGPQARAMARRAAEVVALRNLAAKLHGREATSAGGGGGTSLRAFIRGYEFLPSVNKRDGTVEITVQLPLRSLGASCRAATERLEAVQAQLDQANRDVDDARERSVELRRQMLARIEALNRVLETVRAELEGLRKALIAADTLATEADTSGARAQER